MTEQDKETARAYLYSFLTILVMKNGGMLILKDLSKYAGRNIRLSYDLQVEKDRVVIRAIEVK